jgi:hypothetical protein
VLRDLGRDGWLGCGGVGRDDWKGEVLDDPVRALPGSRFSCGSEELSDVCGEGHDEWRRAGAGLRGQGGAGFIVRLRH